MFSLFLMFPVLFTECFHWLENQLNSFVVVEVLGTVSLVHNLLGGTL